MSQDDIKRLSKAFKALSNPNRLQMFLNLLEESQEAGSLNVHNCFLAKLTRKLNVGAPTVSHHVKELVNAELIHTHKDGKQLICSINPALVHELEALFGRKLDISMGDTTDNAGADTAAPEAVTT